MGRQGGWLGANAVFHQGLVCITTATAAILLSYSPAAQGADWWDIDSAPPNQRPTYDDFGTTGLWQMPTARLHPDSEVAVGASSIYPYDKYFFTFTMLPWLEGTLRYANITDRYYGPIWFSGTQNYKDKSFDVKARLVQEGPYTPDISIALTDFSGTGLWSSEYILASRRYYNFDFTAGLAWGQAATRSKLYNPLRLLSSRFDSRTFQGNAGGIGTDYFAGPSVSPVGGVEWQTPWDSVKVKVEYDGNNYTTDFGLAPDHGDDPHMVGHSPLNFGVVWSPFRFLDLSLARERGLVMASLVMHGNMNQELGIPIVDTPPPPVAKVAVVPAPTPTAPPSPPAQPVPPPIPPENRDVPLQVHWSSAGIVPKLVQTSGRRMLVQLEGRDRVPMPSSLCDGALTAFYRSDDLESVTFTLVEHDQAMAAITFHRDALVRSRQLTGNCYAMSDASWLPDKEAGADGRALADALAMPPPDTGTPSELQLVPAAPDALDAPDQVKAVADAIFAALDKEKMTGIDFSVRQGRATLRFSQSKYRTEATALGRAARIVANYLPPQVSTIELVLMHENLAVATVTLARNDIVNLANGRGSPQEVAQHLEISQPSSADPMVRNHAAYPQFDFGLEPKLREDVDGPQNFFFYQIYALLHADVTLLPGWDIAGSGAQNLYNNLSGLTLPSNSTLPHVRSDLVQYLKGAPTWMDSLFTTYSAALGHGFYGGLTAGYLEMMYAGVEGELLYKPVDARWAVGVDANRVRKRDFDGAFGLQGYEASTGHVALYYRLPYYDLNTSLRVGRYLAGDIGATLDLNRKFGNGMVVGMFATKTNVSATAFGEGSFDKGVYVSIPLDLFTAEHSTSNVGALWRPLTRDGGQEVARPMQLYGKVQGSDSDGLMEGWKDFGK